jgi:PAS domain-containing protein
MHYRVPLSRGDLAAAMAVKGVQGTIRAKGESGEAIFAAVRPVPDSTWFVIARMDSDEVWKPYRRGKTMLAVSATSLILALAALLLVLWRRHRTAVSRELDEASRARLALTEQYDYLSRFANDVILLLGPDAEIVRANDRAADIYGYPVGTRADECAGLASRGGAGDVRNRLAAGRRTKIAGI